MREAADAMFEFIRMPDALGEMPEPVVVPTRGEALGSRYHARVSLIYAIETELISEGAVPEDVEVTFLGSAA